MEKQFAGIEGFELRAKACALHSSSHCSFVNLTRNTKMIPNNLDINMSCFGGGIKLLASRILQKEMGKEKNNKMSFFLKSPYALICSVKCNLTLNTICL